MSEWYVGTSDSESLAHFGTLGMRWGIRKYQNSDGTLTPAGRERYSKLADKYKTKADKYRTRNTVTGDKDMLRKAKYDTKKAKYERKYYDTQNDKYLLKASKYGKKAADIEKRYAKNNLKASKYDKKRAEAEELLNKKSRQEQVEQALEYYKKVRGPELSKLQKEYMTFTNPGDYRETSHEEIRKILNKSKHSPEDYKKEAAIYANQAINQQDDWEHTAKNMSSETLRKLHKDVYDHLVKESKKVGAYKKSDPFYDVDIFDPETEANRYISENWDMYRDLDNMSRGIY